MVARQKIHAGMIHAGKTATVICENNHFQVIIGGETAERCWPALAATRSPTGSPSSRPRVHPRARMGHAHRRPRRRPAALPAQRRHPRRARGLPAPAHPGPDRQPAAADPRRGQAILDGPERITKKTLDAIAVDMTAQANRHRVMPASAVPGSGIPRNHRHGRCRDPGFDPDSPIADGRWPHDH